MSDNVYRRVCETLVEALNISEKDIHPESTLIGDLGAESIDFLDIVFRLEQEFEIRIDRDELFPSALFSGDRRFVENGKLTELGLQEVHRTMPFADVIKFLGASELPDIGALYTVRTVACFIESKLRHV